MLKGIAIAKRCANIIPAVHSAMLLFLQRERRAPLLFAA